MYGYTINNAKSNNFTVFEKFINKYSNNPDELIDAKNVKIGDKLFVSISYRHSGMTGGNCWGDEASFVMYDEAVSLEDFVKMLDGVKLVNLETMTLKEFFTIKDNINKGEYHECGYYGNSTLFKILYVECVVTEIDLKKKNIGLKLT